MNSKSHIEEKSKKRRRGHDLETAILQATWEELQEKGYSKITMGAIADRAKTSKTTIYRRWSNRSEIVLAAVKEHGLFSYTIPVPDTGKLRDDILILLRQHANQLEKIKTETLHGLLTEGKSAILEDFFNSKRYQVHESNLKMMKTILQNAAKRGESVEPNNLSSKVITLPIDLERHEVLFSHEELSEEKLIAIVDDIFLPLLSEKRKKLSQI